MVIYSCDTAEYQAERVGLVKTYASPVMSRLGMSCVATVGVKLRFSVRGFATHFFYGRDPLAKNTRHRVKTGTTKKRKVLFSMSSKTEERSAKETLENLKKLGIKIIVAIVVVALVAGISSVAAGKRVEKKYQETVQKYEDKIDVLEDEHNQMVRRYTNVSTEVDLNLLDTKIAEIAELATMEYRYTDAGRFSDGKELFGFEVPFLKKSFTAKWEGVIKAGIDMGQITYDVNDEDYILTIGIPAAKILSHEILNDTIETLDETKNIFNPISVNDVRRFDAASKEEMEKRAIESDILDKAKENAKNVIAQIFAESPSIYKIQFIDLDQGDTAQ